MMMEKKDNTSTNDKGNDSSISEQEQYVTQMIYTWRFQRIIQNTWYLYEKKWNVNLINPMFVFLNYYDD